MKGLRPLHLLSNGRIGGGVVTLFLFCFGLMGVLGTVWKLSNPWGDEVAVLSTAPTRFPLDGLTAFPGGLGADTRSGVSFSVEVSSDRISVERIDPVIPQSPRIVTSHFLKYLALHLVALLLSFLLPVGRRT